MARIEAASELLRFFLDTGKQIRNYLKYKFVKN